MNRIGRQTVGLARRVGRPFDAMCGVSTGSIRTAKRETQPYNLGSHVVSPSSARIEDRAVDPAPRRFQTMRAQ
jgi:hypothetical protein